MKEKRTDSEKRERKIEGKRDEGRMNGGKKRNKSGSKEGRKK